MKAADVSIGLEGIVVAETALSYVDGAAGRLIIAGVDVEQVAGNQSFEHVASRLWATGSGDPVEGDVRAALGHARRDAFALLPTLGGALRTPDAMDGLRGAVAQLRIPESSSSEPRWHLAAHLTGAVAVFATAWAREQYGLSPIEPDEQTTHAADYLRMLSGTAAREEQRDALDAYFVTVIDHGLNASTFTARVVASTASDIVSAVAAAIGALKGPLHGGAPGPVLEMLDAVGSPSRARDWLRTELAARRRIMGMGHRVYRVRDPRAAVLEQTLARFRASLTARGRRSDAVAARLELARAVEREATALLAARYPNRALRANVEFYTAVLLEALGIPRPLFSATFAAARTAGWMAHYEEERRKGRLIRPSSVYVGPMPERDVAVAR